MDVQINLWGVLLAAVSSMVIGTIWYSPKVMGNEWMRLTKMNGEKMERGRNTSIIIAFLLSLLMAYVLAHVSYLSFKFFGGSFLTDSINTAFWLWLGITFTRTVTHDSFEQRPTKLTAMNVANQLVTMVAMGLTIGLVGY